MEKSKMGENAADNVEITFYTAECMEFVRYGEYREGLGTLGEALKYYDEVLQVKADDYDTKVNKAIALHALNRYEDAIALYKEILSTKANPIVEGNLTDALIAQGEIDLNAKNEKLLFES